jgi:hypothetical protein
VRGCGGPVRSLPLAAYWVCFARRYFCGARPLAACQVCCAASPRWKPGDRSVLIPGLAAGVSFRVVHESYVGAAGLSARSRSRLTGCVLRSDIFAVPVRSPVARCAAQQAPGGNRGIGRCLSPGLRPGFPFGSFMNRAWVRRACPLAPARGLLGVFCTAIFLRRPSARRLPGVLRSKPPVETGGSAQQKSWRFPTVRLQPKRIVSARFHSRLSGAGSPATTTPPLRSLLRGSRDHRNYEYRAP